jgi:hypothetical protein
LLALPVFQMMLQPLDSGELGLVFSEEVEGFVQPAYVIPFKYKDRYWWHYPFYMPGEINGVYADFSLRAETTSSMLYLESDHFSERVRFQVGGLMVQEYEILNRPLFDPEIMFDYVGMHGDLIERCLFYWSDPGI